MFRRRSNPRAFAALALVMGCATTDPGAPRGPVVRQLEIEGNQALSDGDIKKKILTTKTGWWPFATKRRFDRADWQTDLRRIQRLYESRGYYGARIADDDVAIDEVKDEVRLSVTIEENAPVRIGEIVLGGLDRLPDDLQVAVRDDLPATVGGIFRESDWEATKAAVLERLRDRGHALARLEAHALVDAGTNAARLVINVVPGPQYRFGAVDVRLQPGGRVDPTWIHEQVRLAIGWDQVYSDAALAEAQKRVFAMGVFATARVSLGTPDPTAQLLPVVVDAREGPVHTLRLGGGAGIDQVRQETRAVAEWTDRNFFGGLRRLQTRALAGWAFIPTTLAVLRGTDLEGPRHGPIYRVGAEFEQPRLFSRPSIRGRTLLESERSVEQTYDSIGGRAMVGINWDPRSSLSLFPSYNLHITRLNGPSAATAQSAPLTLGCRSDPCFVQLSYLEQIVTADTRDNALEPRRGYYASLSLQEGGGPFGGDFDYVRIMPDLRGYVTVGDDDLFTFAARVRAGSLLTLSGRPEESAVITRFYAGGSMSMRGFAMRRLSPMLLVPIEGSANPADKIALPIGGNGIVEGSFEARARFSQNLLLATFVDFGSVTRRRLPTSELLRMLWAVGLGIRYLTPVGPLRLDIAIRLPVGRPPPLYAPDGTEITYQKDGATMFRGAETGQFVNKSCFGLGGNADHTWVKDGACAFHLSIGEAF